MKNIFLTIVTAIVFFSCTNQPDKNSLAVNGTIKNFTSPGKVYLEQIYFTGQAPVVLDTVSINNGNFSISTKAPEEQGLYRLRFTGQDKGLIFINDQNNIDFTADFANHLPGSYTFNTTANSSLKKFTVILDSLQKELTANHTILKQLEEKGAKSSDTDFINALNTFNYSQEEAIKFCFRYADTTQSPVVGIFAIWSTPVTTEKLEMPLYKLMKRFPEHTGVAAITAFAKQKIAEQKQQTQVGAGNKVEIGSMAPEITMPDTDGKSFSLSSLRGKYVLIDFWASWCGPCRAENPNVVAAYNTFKAKNFTVLGVSLDKSKAPWLKAIEEDKLTWKHISDLQYWNSAAVGLYGFDGIPYNVLVDPQGKVIATELRGEELMKRLEMVLK